MSSISLRSTIKQLREEKGWSQRELANIAGISNGTISRIESNESNAPDSNTLTRLAFALEVPAEFLYKLVNIYDDNSLEHLLVPSNIHLIKGGKTWEQISKELASKINGTGFENIYTIDYLEKLSQGKETLALSKLGALSLYAEVDEEFFCSDKTMEDLDAARESYRVKHNPLNFLSKELQDFVLDPDNAEFIKLAKTAKDEGINPKKVTGFVHSMRK